jgi:hypothetical protein
VPEASPLKTREILAAVADCSPRTAQKALSVKRDAPELLRQVCAGELSLERAARMARTAANPEWKTHEVYYTPAWPIELLAASGFLEDAGLVVEPCVGDGAIVRAFEQARTAPPRPAGYFGGDPYFHAEPPVAVRWITCDIREVPAAHPGLHLYASWTDASFDRKTRAALRKAELVITNPPFSLAQLVLERAWELCPDARVCILQRRTWHDQARAAWFARHQPDELNLSPRIRFVRPDGSLVGDGTDNTIHTWFLFAPGRAQPSDGPHGGISRTLVNPEGES